MKNERAIARLTQSSQADRKEGDLRAVGSLSWLYSLLLISPLIGRTSYHSSSADIGPIRGGVLGQCWEGVCKFSIQATAVCFS
jgi:hypothetical protein